PGPKFLVSARLLLGMGQSAVYACLSRIAQTWFPAPLRTTMQATAAITFGRLGGLSSSILFLTILLGTLGLPWRTATYLFAGSGIAFAFLFAALYRNSPRGHPLVNDAEAELIGQAAGA